MRRQQTGESLGRLKLPKREKDPAPKGSWGWAVHIAELTAWTTALLILALLHIAELDDQLSRAMVIDPTKLSGNKVVFGATVTLVDEDDKKEKYQLVGQAEADAKDGKISYNSPLGRALIGREAEEQAPRVEAQVVVGRSAAGRGLKLAEVGRTRALDR